MKFIADVMVGRLARYLRLAGFDVLYDNTFTDQQIVDIARDQSRIVLSRDSLMFERREFVNKRIDYVFIQDDSLSKQLRQVRDTLDIEIVPMFSRCVECNHKLVSVDKPKVKGEVPPYVFKTQHSFMFCPACNRYYWKGTHYSNIIKNMDKMI